MIVRVRGGQAVVVGWVVGELWSDKVLLVLIVYLGAFAGFAELVAVVLAHFLALVQVSRVYLAYVVLSHFNVVWLILLLDHCLWSTAPWHYLAFQSFVLLAQVRNLRLQFLKPVIIRVQVYTALWIQFIAKSAVLILQTSNLLFGQIVVGRWRFGSKCWFQTVFKRSLLCG